MSTQSAKIVGPIAVLLACSLLPCMAGAATWPKVSATTTQSELVAIKHVSWTSNVSVSIGNGSWTFTSDGIPAANFVAIHYAVPANPFAVNAAGANIVTTSSVLKDQNYDYSLALKPVYTSKVTDANQGPIGVLLDGAALYNPYEANHSTVATSDNFVVTKNGVTASFLDSCDGHPGPGGQYHYHGLPSCLVAYATGNSATVKPVTSTAGSTTTAVSEHNAASNRPVILGFAFDGFGIYDNVAMNGKTVPVSALDSCNGIFSPVPGYPQGIYHYVLENVKGKRSSISCYHGIVSSAYTHALQSILTGPPSRRVAAIEPSIRTSATAQSLAANNSEDELLRAMLQLGGLNDSC